MYQNIKVLIFAANGRQALPVCKGFFLIGCQVFCYCKNKSDTGNLTKYHTKTFFYEEYKNEKEDFFTCGERLIREQRFNLVVPVGDQGATFLSKRKDTLRPFSKIAVNDWDIFQYAIDKLNTMRVCHEQGIPAPRTLLSEKPLEEVDLNKIDFPVVVKPRTGVGSVGFQIIKDKKKLESYLRSYNNSNGPLLIQEYVEQGNHPQLRADFYRDRNGDFKLAMVGKVTRWYPLDGGSGVFAYTIHDEKVVQNCERLLNAIDWHGYANIDIVWDTKSNEAKILEINGRTGATIKLDYLAGANISQLMIEDALEAPVTDMRAYKDNVKMTCLLPDILWFFKSKDRFRTKPSWFNRFGVHDSIFSWDDPLPTFGFVFHAISTFKAKMQDRKRS